MMSDTNTTTAPQVIRPALFKPPPPGGLRHTRRRRGYMLAALAASLGAGVLWFVFTAKSISINVEPAGAAVDIDGGPVLKLADRYLIRSGDYTVNIASPRYYPLQQELVVGAEQNQQFAFQLQRLPGHLRVETTPIDGVEIWVNDELRGTAPLEVRNLSHGRHELKLVADRYLPYTETIEMEGLDKLQVYTAALTPAWSEVTLTTEPAAAEVFVDETQAGQTPLTAEILQGEHNIRITLPGYKSWIRTLLVKANEPMNLPTITLETADAVVSLETTPSRANVTVAGIYAGVTPVEVAVDPGQPVELRFFKDGYQSASRTVTVTRNSGQHLKVTLQAELTPVQFSSVPADAELYIDGVHRGTAMQTLSLTTQPHSVEIRKPGYVDYKTTITPRAGVAQQVIASLKTEQQAKRDAIKAVLNTAAGQPLKLFYPSGYTMGASRREPGRRANEPLRNVVLNRPFYLALREISNAEYRAFNGSHNSGEIQGNSLNGDRQPAVNITWEQAAIYCNWLSRRDGLPPFYTERGGNITGFNRQGTGYRLPSEAEWEWAARVVSKQQVLRYPWGDEMPPQRDSGNFGDESAAHLLGRIVSGYNDGHIATAPVGSFNPSGKGLFDLGGNVSEWVHDFYDSSISGDSSIAPDPLGPDQGEHHVIRGSSWRHGSITELRLSYRDYGNQPRDDLGFRIARYLDP